ncbi:MAG: hypothetical protein WBP42_00610 [Candidatus Zixiibacteriota bacterium]
MATDLEQVLIDSRGETQALLSGNAQGNGYVGEPFACRGKLAWTSYYSDFDSMMQPMPRRILVHGDVIGVVLQEDLILFGNSGKTIRSEVIGDDGLAAFGADSYCWVTQSRQLSCRRYDGTLIIDGHAIPLLNDQSKLRLLYPLGNEFIAVRQYFSGLPVRNTPTSASAYRMTFAKSAWDWIAELEGVVKRALVTVNDELLVVVGDAECHLYALKDGKERGILATGTDSVVYSFVDPADRVVVFGTKLEGEFSKPVIKCLSLEGAVVWESGLLLPITNQTPACGKAGEVYYLESGFLICLVDGVEKWRASHLPTGRSWITTCNSGEIIVTDTKTISVYSSAGNPKMQIKRPNENDSFSTPAAIAANGRLIVSGKFALYCFE